MPQLALNSLDDLRIEVAAHRLVIRAMLTFMGCTGENTAGDTMAQISSMLEGTGPYPMVAADLDDELRKAAIVRARNRMAQFTADIDKLPIARR